MNGFKYATCLDLNCGYYHFKIHPESQKLCGIILPWGNYAYAQLPQGFMPASDIFQAKMSDIFMNFHDVIVYINNVILYTKRHNPILCACCQQHSADGAVHLCHVRDKSNRPNNCKG